MQASLPWWKRLLGQLALFLRDRAVMHENRGAGPAHVLGHGLGRGARLAEEETLLAAGEAGGVMGESGQVRPVHHLDVPLRRRRRWIDHPARALGGPGEPFGPRYGMPAIEMLDLFIRGPLGLGHA